MLKKSERIMIYEWVEENQNNNGAEYPVFECSHCDYVAIRARLRKLYTYADYTIVENNRDTKTLKVFIK